MNQRERQIEQAKLQELKYMASSSRHHQPNFQEEIQTYFCDTFHRIHQFREENIWNIMQAGELRVIDGIQDDFSHRTSVYMCIFLKALTVFDEIICLVENGFVDGAIQRWRTLYEYQVILAFILQQGEEVAQAYQNNVGVSIAAGLKPKTSYAWAQKATIFMDKKHITFRMIQEACKGLNPQFQNTYRMTSQAIHGSSVGTHASFAEIWNRDSLHTGIAMVLSHAMATFYLICQSYYNNIRDCDQSVRLHILNQTYREFSTALRATTKKD